MPRPRRGQPVGEIRPGTMKRFIKYLTDHYKGRLLVVLVCIILSAISMSFSNVFLQQLIDQVILPGMKVGMESVQAKFLRIIGTMGVFYLVGMATSAIYTQIMAGVTQGTLKNLRDEMFDAMEKLPIKYFDTHAHGDIMSTYTNDVDAIRQMIGQSTPTLIQTGLSVLTIVFMMLRYSLWLTLVVFAVILLMFRVTKKLGKESSVYMMRQQKSLAKEEGFIEEMMKGQKVVKVFTHEEESKKEFDAERAAFPRQRPGQCGRQRADADSGKYREHPVRAAGAGGRTAGGLWGDQREPAGIPAHYHRYYRVLPGHVPPAVSDHRSDVGPGADDFHGFSRCGPGVPAHR